MPFQLELPVVKDKWKIWAIAAVVVSVIVAIICWQIWKPKPPKQETYKPAVTQADGSQILEVKPDPEAKPKSVIPPHTVLERSVSVTVKPKAPAAKPAKELTWQEHFARLTGKKGSQTPTAETPSAVTPCPPVTVDLSLVRTDDGTRRVVASSEDGEIVGGVDIPVEAAKPPPDPRRWGLGVSYDPFKNTLGAIVQRSIDEVLPVTIGAEIHQTRETELSSPGFRIHAIYNF